jgi:adenylate kinase family enzyme
VQRVVVVGRGGAGKSTFARELGAASGLPVIELDKEFWNADLEPLRKDVWAQRQARLAASPRWIMDGDLGPYDDLAPRLRRADTVVVLDLPLWRCAWRAWRRGPERRDFWAWTLRWRRVSKPALLRAVAEHAPAAELVVLRSPASVRAWLGQPGRRASS